MKNKKFSDYSKSHLMYLAHAAMLSFGIFATLPLLPVVLLLNSTCAHEWFESCSGEDSLNLGHGHGL